MILVLKKCKKPDDLLIINASGSENFDKTPSDFPKHMSIQKAADVRKAIADIEAATDKVELKRIR